MFHPSEFLSKKDLLGIIWIASNVGISKIPKNKIQEMNLSEILENIRDQESLFSIRLSGQLLLGTARIFQRKYIILAKEAEVLLNKINERSYSRSHSSIIIDSTDPLIKKTKISKLDKKFVESNKTIPNQKKIKIDAEKNLKFQETSREINLQKTLNHSQLKTSKTYLQEYETSPINTTLVPGPLEHFSRFRDLNKRPIVHYVEDEPVVSGRDYNNNFSAKSFFFNKRKRFVDLFIRSDIDYIRKKLCMKLGIVIKKQISDKIHSLVHYIGKNGSKKYLLHQKSQFTRISDNIHPLICGDLYTLNNLSAKKTIYYRHYKSMNCKIFDQNKYSKLKIGKGNHRSESDRNFTHIDNPINVCTEDINYGTSSNKRSEQVFDCLTLSIHKSQKPNVSLYKLVESKNPYFLARLFYDLIHLKSSDCIKLNQKEPFGNIFISSTVHVR
eukprot:gnl/TRDRNA2_/TRDRNA2_177218_c2_seq1.p1 gnl/TRDRNA2_/TRDRNA2_177218_c2~~gnl/TRDRNA2_/TRDRNA2_177218_c2_seq1.p1  ORF type:complete len:442 (-),score=-30.21 gnl/TRDRNA2_/TRDRNA2_177218_c2_seq1:893-2218(-)